jgi:2-dehydro-3-deoxyglucarate aldolase/4-hydroxy-2-oxoheptanedioate aldolase
MGVPANAGRELKEKLRKNETTFGLWVTLESPTVSEIAARIGLDWVCIDTEHGELDLQEVTNHLRAIRGSRTAVLVRVPDIQHGLIQRVLGMGAHGIMVPRIRTAEEVERTVYFAKYPPRGMRGMGVERATSWGMNTSHARNANQDSIVIPLMETVDAGRNLEQILKVPDVDGFFFGPADYSASAGFVGEWEGPGVAEELLAIKDRIRNAGLCCGIVSRGREDGTKRIQQGFQMIGLGVDCTLLAKTVVELMDGFGRPVNSDVWAI